MKKLITLTSMGLMLLGGSAFAQDAPVRDGRPADQANNFRIPRIARDNPELQQSLTDFREASATFKTNLAALRASLATASVEQKAEIIKNMRQLLKDNSNAQREFRKKVRDVLRTIRQDRVTDSEG